VSRFAPLLLLVLLAPLPGCLENPCSRHEELCAGGPGTDGPQSCDVLPLVAAGDLSDDEGDATDVWALRVTPDFSTLQVLSEVDSWDPKARMWLSPGEPVSGDDECACGDSGCPAMTLGVDSPSWVFVEVWDGDDDESADRGYTLHAPGVGAALLLRDGVAHAAQPGTYGTTPPGLCALDSVNSIVQLPWLSEREPNDGPDYHVIGALEDPGLCILATMSDCSDQDRFTLTKVGDAPVRLRMVWDGPANLDVNMIPGGSAYTTNNPETIVASLDDGVEFSVEVACAAAQGPVAYAVAIWPY